MVETITLRTPNGFEREVNVGDIHSYSHIGDEYLVKLKDGRTMTIDEDSYKRLSNLH